MRLRFYILEPRLQESPAGVLRPPSAGARPVPGSILTASPHKRFLLSELQQRCGAPRQREAALPWASRRAQPLQRLRSVAEYSPIRSSPSSLPASSRRGARLLSLARRTRHLGGEAAHDASISKHVVERHI